MKFNAISMVQFLADDGHDDNHMYYCDYSTVFARENEEQRNVLKIIRKFLHQVAIWDIYNNIKKFMGAFSKDEFWYRNYSYAVKNLLLMYGDKIKKDEGDKECVMIDLNDNQKAREHYAKKLRIFFDQVIEAYKKETFWDSRYDKILEVLNDCYPDDCIRDRWDCEKVVSKVLEKKAKLKAKFDDIEVV